MAPVINNTLDILWLLIGFVSVVVLLAIFFPWGFMYEVVALTMIVIWIAFKFWIREGWNGLKKLCRKKRKWRDVDDHQLFI